MIYNKEVQTADIEVEPTGPTEEEIRQQVLQEQEAERERLAREKELEEQSLQLDKEIEEEIRGRRSLTAWRVGGKNDCPRLLCGRC